MCIRDRNITTITTPAVTKITKVPKTITTPITTSVTDVIEQVATNAMQNTKKLKGRPRKSASQEAQSTLQSASPTTLNARRRALTKAQQVLRYDLQQYQLVTHAEGHHAADS